MRNTVERGTDISWPEMFFRGAHARLAFVSLVLVWAVVSASCGRLLKKEYEYEEELYLALDGSATLNVNASVASLVALRGADLPVDPRARIDRERVRAIFAGPDTVVRVSLSRRDGRRFVHASVDVTDVRNLSSLAPFNWSSYRFDRQADVFEFHQVVGKPTGVDIGNVGWTGQEVVAFRIHVPSKIPFHNAPSRRTERGNILEWEQPLVERLQGSPVDIQVQMDAQSILSRTLLLFGSTIIAAAATFALVIWWVARRGRAPSAAESRS
jgi:hypothetical protein